MNAVLEEVFARRHRTTVSEYHRMGELGLFAPDARRQVKAPLYAADGVAEVWILDLKADELHILRSPAVEGYQETSVTSTPGIMTLAAFPDLTVDLSRLFV